MLGKNQVKDPLWRARRRAGLRRIDWHALRQGYASHVTVRGAPVISPPYRA